MTRVIKFRAWEKPGVLLSNTEGTVEFHGKLHDIRDDWKFFVFCLERPSEYDIEQFTGLLDKNGKEIYEGDIVRVLNMTGENWSEVDSIEVSPVTFHDGMFSFGEHRTVPMTSRIWQSEVIGNIHENLDLLS